MEYNIKIYQTKSGKSPFNQWLHDLSDRKTKSIIHLRLERLKLGSFGDCKTVCKSIYELKIDWGPGYRIYFSKIGLKIVLLLCAGNKKTQQKDILKAQIYLDDYSIQTKGEKHA